MKANDTPPPSSPPRAVSALRPRETLQFRLAASFAVLLVLLLAVAAIGGRYLVHRSLVVDAYRAEREAGLRLALQFSELAQRAETLALSLAATAAAIGTESDALRRSGSSLLDAAPDELPFIAVGIWPEPGALGPGSARGSLLWLRTAKGPDLRDDYNDPRVAPYWQERWYTPARHLDSQRCYWSVVTDDPLLKTPILRCSLPIVRAGRFSGVVTVALPLDALHRRLAALSKEDPGYSLLLDAEDRILAASPELAEKLPREGVPNLARLAQALPAYNALALSLHDRREALLTQFRASPLAAAELPLAEGTREWSRPEATVALFTIWLASQHIPLWDAKTAVLEIGRDPVLGQDSLVSVFELRDPAWRLVRFAPRQQGFAGADVLYLRNLLLLGGMSALLLLLLYWRLYRLLLQPLRRMVLVMSETASVNDHHQLLPQTQLGHELGLFAHWHNERVRQVRDLLDRNRSLSSQIAQEGQERRSIGDTLNRLQERHALALQALEEAVVLVDEQGRIEDMNPAAQRLCGKAVTASDRPRFADTFIVRSEVAEAGGKVDLSLPALERGQRIHYAEDLWLVQNDREQQVSASAIPLHGRGNRVSGAIVVLRPLGSSTPARETGVASSDPLTGLPQRAACEERLRELLEAAKLAPRAHTLLWLDVDQMTRINDSHGLAGGNQALMRLAELLRKLSGTVGEVFRIASDKFALLLPSAPAEPKAQRFAEALRRTVQSTRMDIGGQDVRLSLSIGVAEFNEHTESVSEILRRAREACDAAKRSGRNAVRVYDQSLSQPTAGPDDALWVRRLRAGLGDDLLRLSMQRIPGVREGETAGFELQLMLEDEEGFWTPAPVFMPVAERHRLAQDLDRWLLEQALALLASPPEAYRQLAFLGVRISAHSLADARFPETISGLLARHEGVGLGSLCFLVDRETLLLHPQQAQTFAAALAALGGRLAIDRFEARSSGELALLKRVRAAFARIDGAGYPLIAGDSVQQGLAAATVNVARSLGCRIIVSGIDADAQLPHWRRLGVDYLQGNALARATPLFMPGSG